MIILEALAAGCPYSTPPGNCTSLGPDFLIAISGHEVALSLGSGEVRLISTLEALRPERGT